MGFVWIGLLASALIVPEASSALSAREPALSVVFNNNTQDSQQSPPKRRIIGPKQSTLAPKPPATPTPPPQVSPTPNPPPTIEPSESSTLEQEPVLLESLGLRLFLPKGAVISKPVKGAMPIYTVDDTQVPPRFHLQIQQYVSSLPDPSPEVQVKDYLDSMQRKGANAKVLANVPWIADRVPAHLLWTSTDLGEGVIAVQGWLIMQTGPYDFIVTNALCAGREFQAIRPTLEACFRSMSLDDLEKTAGERSERLRRGNAVLSALTEEALRAIGTTKSRDYRVFGRNDKGAEVEVGYYRISTACGNMSDASGERPIEKHENPAGLLVIVQGRTIVNAEEGRFADTESRFWTAFDRGSEAWSSRVTERGGKEPERSFAQTGLRSARGLGNPRQTLLVINADAQSRTRDETEWVVPTGIYLSQAEVLLLGELLPRDGSCTGSFSYYAFDPRSMQMPQRVETWTPSANDQWLLVTQPGLDEAAEVSTHDPSGRRVRRSEPEGIVTELREISEIEGIWRAKGIPTK